MSPVPVWLLEGVSLIGLLRSEYGSMVVLSTASSVARCGDGGNDIAMAPGRSPVELFLLLERRRGWKDAGSWLTIMTQIKKRCS